MNKAKRVCPTCKTTKFRKATDSGLVCKYGHKLLGIQQETAEDEGMAAGRGTRRRTVAKVVESEKPDPVQQKSDFLLIIQYALQVFSKSMVQELNFPPELEPTVRELWLLYISDSKREIAEAYQFEAHEREVMDKLKSKSEIKRDIYEKIEQEELTLDDVLGEDDSSSGDDDADEATVNATQQFNTKSKRAAKDPKTQRYKSSRNQWPSLVYGHTLSFIYLACIYLNYPILPNDLVRWSKMGQIPYLSIQEKVPERQLGMLSFHLTNSMTHIPSMDTIVMDSYKLSRCFLVNCKLQFPNFNIPLYLDRFCAQLFLPVEGYFYANMLFERRYNLSQCITNRTYQSTTVTTFLMSCVIAAAKLIYGLGDIYDVTSSQVSEFDTKTTRREWLTRIKENIARWKQFDDDQDDLGNIITLIRGVTVASRAGAYVKDKQNVILNVMNQSISSDNNHTQRINKPITQTNMLMDTYDMVSDTQSDPPTEIKFIKQGDIYYKRRNGFAPEDYLNVLELAHLITGDPTDNHLETAVKEVDQMIVHTQSTSVPKQSKLEERYYSMIPSP